MSATVSTREEWFLGTVFVVTLPTVQREDGEYTDTAYELNVVDGWIKRTETTTDGGILRGPDEVSLARIGDVLAVAGDHLNTVAGKHLAYVAALRAADLPDKATNARRALVRALAKRGLRLAKPTPAAAA